MIKVNYHLKEFPNITLFKFFKTENAIGIFKSKNPDYVFIGDE